MQVKITADSTHQSLTIRGFVDVFRTWFKPEMKGFSCESIIIIIIIIIIITLNENNQRQEILKIHDKIAFF